MAWSQNVIFRQKTLIFRCFLAKNEAVLLGTPFAFPRTILLEKVKLMLIDIPTSGDHIAHILPMIKLCYEFAFIEGRALEGYPLTSSEKIRLSRLKKLLTGDPEGTNSRQRRLRRLPVIMPVLLKTARGLIRGTLLNISGKGMFIATREVMPKGTRVQVLLGKPDQVEYRFSCIVAWVALESGNGGLGLTFSGIPLEIRHGYTLKASA